MEKKRRIPITKTVWFLVPLSLLLLSSSIAYPLESRALLIGISQYEKIDCLAYADNDAKVMAGIIRDFDARNQSNVTLLLNLEATKKNIETAFDDLIEKTKRKAADRVLVMFCGHGRPGELVPQKTNIFLAPSDVSISPNDFYVTESGYIENDTFISKAWLARQIALINAATIVVVFDSCYSGIKDFGDLFAMNLGYRVDSIGNHSSQSQARGIVVVEKRRSSVVSQKKYVAMLAASSEQSPSFEYDALRHGAMSYCIIDHIDKMRAATYEDEERDILIGALYKDIRRLFTKITIDGIKLADTHQPLLFPIPNYEDISDLKLITIRGTKIRSKKKYGTVQFVLDVAGADLYIGNKFMGKAHNQPFQLAEGQYRAALRLPKYDYAHGFTLEVRHDQLTTKTFSLRGDLIVESYWDDKGGLKELHGLDVYIDGKYAGKSKLAKKGLVAGTHSLEIRYGQESKKRKIEIRPDSPLRVKYLLIKQAKTNDSEKKKRLKRLIKIPS